jgi:hypothetical protein
VLLAPTVCLHRGPLGGRNFESFSEDPYLTGKLAASYINGLQGKGVAATIKREFRRSSRVTCRILANRSQTLWVMSRKHSDSLSTLSSKNVLFGNFTSVRLRLLFEKQIHGQSCHHII